MWFFDPLHAVSRPVFVSRRFASGIHDLGLAIVGTDDAQCDQHCLLSATVCVKKERSARRASLDGARQAKRGPARAADAGGAAARASSAYFKDPFVVAELPYPIRDVAVIPDGASVLVATGNSLVVTSLARIGGGGTAHVSASRCHALHTDDIREVAVNPINGDVVASGGTCACGPRLRSCARL